MRHVYMKEQSSQGKRKMHKSKRIEDIAQRLWNNIENNATDPSTSGTCNGGYEADENLTMVTLPLDNVRSEGNQSMVQPNAAQIRNVISGLNVNDGEDRRPLMQHNVRVPAQQHDDEDMAEQGCKTFSNFTEWEQLKLRLDASRIHEGATFSNYSEFECCLKAYKIVTNSPFRVASSEKMRDGDGKIIERYQYNYVVFHCAYYGEPRKRGKGKRSNQSYLPSGCKAKFRLAADTVNEVLRIKSMRAEHEKHANNEADFSQFIRKKRRKQNRSIPNGTSEAMPTTCSGSASSLTKNIFPAIIPSALFTPQMNEQASLQQSLLQPGHHRLTSLVE